eukprot:1354851-Amorphochlora_amoeboformis.AAC.1
MRPNFPSTLRGPPPSTVRVQSKPDFASAPKLRTIGQACCMTPMMVFRETCTVIRSGGIEPEGIRSGPCTDRLEGGQHGENYPAGRPHSKWFEIADK